MFEKIKKDLPNFPDEVIKDWLEPFAISDGWPPTEPRWKNLLGRPVEEWMEVSWKHTEVNLKTLAFSRESHDAIDGLHQAYNLSKINTFSSLLGEAGKQRYMNAFYYLIEHGIFPKPIVILKQGSFHHIVDGNHRFLAWTSALKFEQEIKEVPEDEMKEFKSKLQDKLGIQKFSPVAKRQPIWLAEDPNYTDID